MSIASFLSAARQSSKNSFPVFGLCNPIHLRIIDDVWIMGINHYYLKPLVLPVFPNLIRIQNFQVHESSLGPLLSNPLEAFFGREMNNSRLAWLPPSPRISYPVPSTPSQPHSCNCISLLCFVSQRSCPVQFGWLVNPFDNVLIPPRNKPVF